MTSRLCLRIIPLSELSHLLLLLVFRRGALAVGQLVDYGEQQTETPRSGSRRKWQVMWQVPKKKKDTYLPGRVEENDKNLIQNPTTSRLLAQLTQI